VRCWLSNSSPPASPWWTCHRSWPPGYGLDNNHSDKTDTDDARSTAIVALRNSRPRQVSPEDHSAVLRLLAKRHHDVVAARTGAICRLHTTVCFLVEGHLPRRLRAQRAARIVAGIHPTTAIEVERKALARGVLAEVRCPDRELADHLVRVRVAVIGSGTTVTELYGVGPIVAAYLLGYSGDVGRFPNSGHYARYNATAPIEASSGPVIRRRLNPRGSRQLNHAIHMIAVIKSATTRPVAPTTSAGRPRATVAETSCEHSSGASATLCTGISSTTPAAADAGPGGHTGRLQWPA
jgi:transposase